MYQHFWENINPEYVGMDENRYTQIGKNEIALVLSAFDEEIKNLQLLSLSMRSMRKTISNA